MGVPQASILQVGFVSYCHDRSGQQTKTGTSETKSPTRKPDVRGTPIHLPTWCPVRPPAWARLWGGFNFWVPQPFIFCEGCAFSSPFLPNGRLLHQMFGCCWIGVSRSW